MAFLVWDPGSFVLALWVRDLAFGILGLRSLGFLSWIIDLKCLAFEGWCGIFGLESLVWGVSVCDFWLLGLWLRKFDARTFLGIFCVCVMFRSGTSLFTKFGSGSLVWDLWFGPLV